MRIQGSPSGNIHGGGPARSRAVHERIVAARGDFVLTLRNGDGPVEDVSVFIRVPDAGLDEAVVRVAEGAHVVNGGIFRSLVGDVVTQRDGIFRRDGGHGQGDVVADDDAAPVGAFAVFSGGQNVVAVRILLERSFKGNGPAGGNAFIVDVSHRIRRPDVGHLAAGKVVVPGNGGVAANVDVSAFCVNVHVIQGGMVADGDSGLVAHGSGHVYGPGAVFLFKDGDGIQFHGNGVQRDRGQFRAISYEDGAFGIQIIIFDGAVAADEYVAVQTHGFLNAGSGLVAALVVLDGNAGREHQGSRGDFRPVRGGNVAAVSQENVAAGIEVAVSCRT